MMEAGAPPGEGSPPAGRYRFGDVVVDTIAHTLTRDGAPCQVEPKAFAVLVTLLGHAGELVSHEELLDGVWGHRHVTAGVLTRAIAQLRAVLGDDAHQPRYIQTQHALGYRFVAEVAFEPVARRMGTSQAGAGAISGVHPLPTAGVAKNDQAHDAIAGQAPVAPPQARARPSLVGRRVVWFAAGAIAVIAAVLLVIGYQRNAAPPRVAEASVAVMPFTSLSDAPDDRYFADGLAVEMHHALAGVPDLKVAALPTGGNGANDEDPRELGRRLGVATVLDASVRREADQVRVSARLTDAASGFILWSDTYSREASDIFALQAEIADKVVMALLGVLPQESPRLAQRLRPTSDVGAYELYLKGLSILQVSGSREQLGDAVAFFQQALDRDPQFGRAQTGICRAQVRLFELNRDADALGPAQEACIRAARLDASLREVSLAMGDLHRAQRDFDAAREDYMKALEDAELRPAAYIGLGLIVSEQGDNALAMDYFERARAVRPGDATVHRMIGYQHYREGRTAEAIESYKVACALAPDDAGLWSSLGGLHLAAGDRLAARRTFEHALSIKPVFGALSNLGTLSYDEGDYARAAGYFRQAAELNSNDYRIFGNTGDALSLLPDGGTRARIEYRKAAEKAERFVAINDSDAQALASLAWYHANLGEAEAARRRIAEAEAIGTTQGEVALRAAEVHARLGDAASARSALARARAQGIPESRIQSSPFLRELAAVKEVASQGG